MSTYISILIAGFGGGMVRGLIGFVKNQYSYKNTGFSIPYFVVMAFISGIIGLLTALAVNNSFVIIEGMEYVSPAVAFIIGYAGGDFLDNAWKIIANKIKFK